MKKEIENILSEIQFEIESIERMIDKSQIHQPYLFGRLYQLTQTRSKLIKLLRSQQNEAIQGVIQPKPITEILPELTGLDGL